MDDKDTIDITGGSTSSDDTIVLDLGNYNLDQSMSSGSISTITIDPSWTISSNGASYTTTDYQWNTFASNPSVNIDSDGITMQPEGDLKIGDRSLKNFMDSVEERLGILRPNPELEDRWEQLKELRKQYQALEKDLLEKEKIMKILKEQ